MRTTRTRSSTATSLEPPQQKRTRVYTDLELVAAPDTDQDADMTEAATAEPQPADVTACDRSPHPTATELRDREDITQN